MYDIVFVSGSRGEYEVKKLIKRVEALEIAREILLKAEKERLSISEFEANTGLNYDS